MANKSFSNVKVKVTHLDLSKDASRSVLVSGENISHSLGKIARWYKDIAWTGHTHTKSQITDFAHTHTSLDSSVDKGAENQPVYFVKGVPTAIAYTIKSSVPENAVFTDTNTKVTSVGNHYTPSGGTTTSASGGTLTDITNSANGIQVVTGVTKDAAGHVTGVTSIALKSVNSNTTYAAGTGISMGSGNVINHSNSITAVTTAAFKKFKYDAQGHITGTADVTAADLPSHTHSQYLTAHQSLDGRAINTTIPANLNSATTPGFYNAQGGNTSTNKPTSDIDHYGLMTVHNAAGSYYTQIAFSDNKDYIRRCVNGTWGAWSEVKFTDTVYTHPSHTAASSGLYKITVNSLGHVTAATAVTKADITALGIPGSDTNTTYSAGTGLALSGTTFYTTIPRVTKDSKAFPGANKVVFEEYSSGDSYNLPSNAWYHIISMQGTDVRYGTQLALGMTANNKMYFRNYNNAAWSNWNEVSIAHSHPYLPLSGGTLTGALTLPSNQYTTNSKFGIDCKNSDIINANVVQFGDLADSADEGLQFYRDGTKLDVIWVKNGVIYFTPNHTQGSSSSDTNYTVYHSGNLTLSTLGGAASSHTHSYAKSESVNGPAYSVAGTQGTTEAYRHVWFSVDSDDTRRAYADNFKYEPALDTLKFGAWYPVDITGQTVNLNDYTDGSGKRGYRRYICKTTGGGNNISNKPSDSPFVLEVILIRFGTTSTDFITKQIYHSYNKKTYQRFCVNNTWDSWSEIKTTDTVYTHPSHTAVSSGLYKITVNSLGHVTGTAAVAAADLPSHTHSGYATSSHTHDYTNPLVRKNLTTSDAASDSKTDIANSGLSMNEYYNNTGGPAGVSYGNIINVKGTQATGAGQLFLQWNGSDNTGDIYYRSHRDMSTAKWGAWKKVAWDGHKHTKSQITDFPTSMPASDVYSWAKASTKPTYTASEVGALSSTTKYAASNSVGGPALYVHDSNDLTKGPIEFAYTGSGLTADQATHLAAFTQEGKGSNSQVRIRDLSFANLKTKLGLGSAAYTASTAYAAASHTHSQYYDSGISRTANTVLAAPNGSAGSATFRKLVAADIPALNYLPRATYTTAQNADNLNTTGWFDLNVSNNTNVPTTNNGLLLSEMNVGTKFQLWFPDNANTIYKRYYNISNSTWNNWVELKLTDTVYTHPSHTAASSGLYKITVNSLGHVTAATAVAKSDITALGIPGSDTNNAVTQSATTTTNYRPILSGATNVGTSGTGLDATITSQAYVSNMLFVQPSTGRLYARNLVAYNVDGGDVIVEWNRSGNASWRMVNTGGSLYLQCNYTTVKTDYYNAAKFNHNKGAVELYTGTLQIGNSDKASAGISFKTTNYTGAYLRVYDTGNAYNHDVVLNSTGSVMIGAGESASAIYTNNVESIKNSENMALSADGDIFIYTGANTINARKRFKLTQGGNFGFTGMSGDWKRYCYWDGATGGTDSSALAPTSGLIRAGVWGYSSSIYTYFISADTGEHYFTANTYGIFAGCGSTNGAGGGDASTLTKHAGVVGVHNGKDAFHACIAAPTSLTSNQTIRLPDDSGLMTNIIFKSSNELVRHCRAVHDASDVASKPWHKVASINVGGTYQDRTAVFLVTARYLTRGGGILVAHVRTTGTAGTVDGVSLRWIVRSSQTEFNSDRFQIRYTNNTGSSKNEVTAEIWCKIETQYFAFEFDLISANDRATTNGSYSYWTLNSDTTGSASYTAGTGGSASVIAKIANNSSQAIGAKSANGFYGMTDPDLADNVWIRTTSNGIIPYQSGGAGSGHGSLGTSSWYFANAYIDSMHGTADRAINSNNCKTTVTDPSSNTSYGVVFVADPNTSEDNTLRKSNDFRFNHWRGAANTEGWSELILGNSTAKTAANNSTGRVSFYNGTGNWAHLNAGSYTSNIEIYLPSSGGTMTNVVYKTAKTATAVSNTGWTNNATDDNIVPTMSFMTYWNGRYNSSSSNLQYCNRGAFGTIVTAGVGDYVKISKVLWTGTVATTARGEKSYTLANKATGYNIIKILYTSSTMSGGAAGCLEINGTKTAIPQPVVVGASATSTMQFYFKISSDGATITVGSNNEVITITGIYGLII